MNRIYNNYISGSVSQISGCLEIILYNKFDFTERISLYNLESFCLKYLVGASDKYVRITRTSPDVWFEYRKQLTDGFNIVVYISSVSNSPIGYTEFVNTQGQRLSLGIWINIRRTWDGEFLDLTLKNQLVGKDLSRKYQGNQLYNYTTIGEVESESYRNLFTSDIGRTESDRYSFIIRSSGFTSKEESWKIKLRRDIEVDSRLTQYNICFYNGKLMLAAWKDRSYVLYPLVENSGVIGGSTDHDIERIEGRYYFDTDRILRDIDTEEEFIKKWGDRTQFCDFLDPHNQIYEVPTLYTRDNIFKYIPEINNIYVDLDNYLKSNQVIIYAKIGSWFILARDYGGTYVYIAISPTTLINLTYEDLKRAIFVGDQTLILCEEGDSEHSGYYTVYSTSGIELLTERAREIYNDGNGRLDWCDSGFRFFFLDTIEDETHFEEYYGDNGLVSIVYDYEELGNTILGRYRRNIYPKCQGIPQLIGSFGGLIFYKVGSKINWL